MEYTLKKIGGYWCVMYGTVIMHKRQSKALAKLWIEQQNPDYNPYSDN